VELNSLRKLNGLSFPRTAFLNYPSFFTFHSSVSLFCDFHSSQCRFVLEHKELHRFGLITIRSLRSNRDPCRFASKINSYLINNKLISGNPRAVQAERNVIRKCDSKRETRYSFRVCPSRFPRLESTRIQALQYKMKAERNSRDSWRVASLMTTSQDAGINKVA